MIGTTIDITYAGTVFTLNRVDDSKAYQATYFLSLALTDFQLDIVHEIPAARGKGQESHLVKLTRTKYDADGVILRIEVVWSVMKTHSGYTQDDVDLHYLQDALTTVMTSANIDKVLQRQS